MSRRSDCPIVPGYVHEWFGNLRPEPLSDVCVNPREVAVFCADMTNAFCCKGNLASARVAALAAPVAALFRRAYDLGVRQYVLPQDAHSPRAPEFRAFGSHAVAGSEETETVPEIRGLPFAHIFKIVAKNSLHPAVNTSFDCWVEEHPEVSTAIVVGDCTDLCVYHLAMYLRLRANALDLSRYEVIVPTRMVDTCDSPHEAAAPDAPLAHPSDFFHEVFLYHMSINGIRVVRDLV